MGSGQVAADESAAGAAATNQDRPPPYAPLYPTAGNNHKDSRKVDMSRVLECKKTLNPLLVGFCNIVSTSASIHPQMGCAGHIRQFFLGCVLGILNSG
jgi:hypothetical protein